jgi:hypothetical protein
MPEPVPAQGSPGPDAARSAKHSRARRQLLKSLAAGSAVAAVHVVPDRWIRPVVEQVVVPAYAQASGPTMTALLTLPGQGVQVAPPGGDGVEIALDDGTDAIGLAAQATLINPPVPGQDVTLTFDFDPGAGDADLDAGGPFTAASDPGTGLALFGSPPLGGIALVDSGSDSDVESATLVATFTSAGVPSVVITVDFALLPP